MTLPPGLLRDFLLREGAPFAEHSLDYVDVDATAWEGAVAEIKKRREVGFPVPRTLADFACDVATGRATKPKSDNRGRLCPAQLENQNGSPNSHAGRPVGTRCPALCRQRDRAVLRGHRVRVPGCMTNSKTIRQCTV